MTATEDSGIATETSGPTQAETNFKSFESAFDKISLEPSNEDAISTNQPIVQREEAKSAPEAKKTEAAPAENGEEPEFPPEMMGKEPAKEEAPKDELDEIQPSQKMGQESRANFDKLKAIARTHKEELARVKSELEAVKSKPAIIADSEALKQAHDRIKEMEQTLERSNFQLSPKFKAIVSEKNQAITDAKAYLEGSEIDPSVIDLAARLTGPKRVAALRDAGLDAETIASISPFLAHADRKERESAQALEQSASMRQEWEAQERQAAQARKAQERAEEDRIYTEVGQRVSKVFAPFQTVPGQDKWNAQVERLNAEAKEFFNGSLPIDKMAEIAYYGVGAKVVDRMNNSLKTELKVLREENAKLKAAQPGGLGNSNGRQEAIKPPSNPDELRTHLASSFEREFGRG
jgi:hypothetical protein